MPSYTVERDIAADLRDWLFETALKHHDETDSAESLADLAAIIDRELQEQPDAIELSVTPRTGPAGSRDTSRDDESTGNDQRPNTAGHLDDDHTAPSQGPVSVHYQTPFECTVCRDVRTLATYRRVCAFVEACPNCGAVARFTAARSPTPYKM
jgi:predicted RNA-binding Zn-ribbon protein involved in translation (DUF1610 family)